jgi:RNA polymerase sigma-70 factor (ECF subfamily)
MENTKHWRGRLMQQYSDEIKRLTFSQKKLDLSKSEDALDDSIISSMVRSLKYSLTYMKTGRQPDSCLGTENRDAYCKPITLDEMSYFPSLTPEPEHELSKQEASEMWQALRILTLPQRNAYILNTGYMMTEREIALELGISRRTVRTHLERAKQKIHSFRQTLQEA